MKVGPLLADMGRKARLTDGLDRPSVVRRPGRPRRVVDPRRVDAVTRVSLALLESWVIGVKEHGMLVSPPGKEPLRSEQRREDRATLQVPIVGGDAAPRGKQRQRDAIGTRTVLADVDELAKSPRLARLTKHDDVVGSGRQDPPSMRVLVGVRERVAVGGNDTVNGEQFDDRVDQNARASLSPE